MDLLRFSTAAKYIWLKKNLFRAAEDGNAPRALELITGGADVHAKEAYGKTPLHLASTRGHATVVEALLANGANVNAKDDDGRTPRSLAESRGLTEVVKILDRAENKKENKNKKLLRAARDGDASEALKLIAGGADVQAKDNEGQTSLHLASRNGHAAVAEALLANGADVHHAKNHYGQTPLQMASKRGYATVVKALLANGANVHTRTIHGKTPRKGKTPLHFASRNGHADVVKALLGDAADVHAKDNEGETPLHLASGNGHAALVKVLLDNGADVHTNSDYGGGTPLHSASMNGHATVVKALLADGANVNAKSKHGHTPLHLASWNGHAAVVELLLANGADVHAESDDGSTPRNLAESRGHVEVVGVFNLLGSVLGGMDDFNHKATDTKRGAGGGDRFRAKSNPDQLEFLKVGREPARFGKSNTPVISRERQSTLSYDEWVDLPGMSTARYGCAAAAIGEKLYAAGGCDRFQKHLATAEVLDSPTTNEWRKLPPMKICRSGCAAAAADGRLYVFGGNDGSRTTDMAERYDPEAGVWEALPKMPKAREHCGAVTIGRKIYVIGGRNNNTNVHANALATVSVFDVTSHTWDAAELPPMSTARHLCAVVVVDRFLIVVGGSDSQGFLLSSIEVFDTERWTWIGGCAEMKTANGACSASALSGRRLVVAGGLGRNTVETISLDELLPREELMRVVTSDLEKGRTSSLLIAIVEGEGDGDDAAARRLQQMCDNNKGICGAVDRIRRAATRKEIIAATQEGGVCPLRRGRVTLVGRARSGKTSLLRALEGKGHDCAQKSTVGIDISDADVRDIGIDIRDMAAQEGLGEPWMAVDREKNTKEHAIRKQVAHLMDDVDALKSSKKKSESEALEDLLKKYGLGKELEEQKEEILNRKPLLPMMDLEATRRKEQGDLSNTKPAQSKSEDESFEQSLRTIRAQHDAALTPTYSGVSTEGYSYNEQEEGVARRFDFNVEEDDGNLLRLSVWDYGGQDVFRIILNMYLPRSCCYVVVFRAIDLLDDTMRDGAIDDLNDWVQAIDTHATCQQNQLTGDATQDRAIRSAPVLLVGTHFDLIKTDPDCKEKLVHINNVLKENFQHIDSIQTSEMDCIDGREFLYNGEEDLCFWPVDNTNSSDANIMTLRHSIVKAIVEDKAAYLEDLIPLPWLEVLDRLSIISEDEPLLPVYSKDSSKQSVVGLMRQAGALGGFGANIGGKQNAEAEKRRAVALLQFFHQLGALVYFDTVPVLQHHCILDPQWLMDNITYVVRDFKLHRFLRDYNAMELDEGDQWKTLLTNGILGSTLLRQFWLGEDENHDFLVCLMIKIGVFAPLPTSKDHSLHRFLVPSVLSSAGAVSSVEGSSMEIHPLFDQVCKGRHERVSIDFSGFLPRGFYERSVARLVGDWAEGYDDYDPVIFPNISHLVMGSRKYPFTLLCYHEGKIELITTDIDHAAYFLPHVRHAMDAINSEIYGKRLSIVYPPVSSSSKAMIRQHPSQWDITQVQTDEASIMKRMKEVNDDYTNLVSFFTEYNAPPAKAEKFSRLIHDEGCDKDSLIGIYEDEASDGGLDGFRECLKEMGISKRMDQALIIRVLRKYSERPEQKQSERPEPKQSERPEPKQYLVGFVGGNNLDVVHKERDMIPRLLAPSGLQATFHDMGPLDVIAKTNDNKSVVLHFAMHGNAETRTGHRTLAFRGFHTADLVEPGLLAETIASCCVREDGRQSGSVQLVVFNACHSDSIACLLKSSQHQVPWVISWKTAVDNEAAQTFAEALYHFLGKNRDNCENFANAFERASSTLKLRCWLIDEDGGDPEGPSEKLRSRQLRERNPTLAPAGIPHLHMPSKNFTEQKVRGSLIKEYFDDQRDGLSTESSSGMSPVKAELPSSHRAFASLRFDDEVPAHAEQLRAAMRSKGADLQIVAMKGGGDIDDFVSQGILAADYFIVFGSAKYGENTGNPASTYFESKFAHSLKKKIILIRMIPFDEEFEFSRAKFLFGINMLELHWMLNAPMPAELPGQVLDAMGITGNGEVAVSIPTDAAQGWRKSQLLTKGVCFDLDKVNKAREISRTNPDDQETGCNE